MDELTHRGLGANPPAQRAADRSDTQIAASTEACKEIEAEVAHLLRRRGFLYDDPDAYAAGVRDALSEVDARLDAPSEPPSPLPEQ
jgi:hypothetical protein